MSCLNVGYLQSYSVDGQLNFWGGGHKTISYSSDNQIALVHKKGVNIYECRQTPGVQKRPPILTVFSSQIDGPGQVYAPDTGAATVQGIMDGDNKQNTFELMRDPILKPHGFDSTLFLNYFIKAEWSTVPVYRGQNNECRCILGVLTSSHQLLIYGRRNRRFTSKEEWSEPWELLIDLTSRYNTMLLKSWESTTPSPQTYFEKYKSRLYELSIVDFLWIPDWRLEPDYKNTDEAKGVFKTYLITVHANGDLNIWKLMSSKTVGATFTAVIVFKTIIVEDDVISTVAYSLISSNLGLLIVGTNKGRLLAYVFEKRKRIKKEKKKISKGPFPKYTIHDGQDLWEEDMMKIESVLLQPESSGRTKITILAVKHPNIVIAASLKVSNSKVMTNEFSILKVPNGPITGLSENTDKMFIVLHEPGVLSFISYANENLQYILESNVSIFDPNKTGKKKKNLLGGTVQKIERPKKKIKDLKDKRLIFQGLALSPNKSLLCVARTIGMYYDHLKIRKPSHIVFYSLLPQENMWSYVQKLYAENHYSMRAIVDVLVPFRYNLRGKSSQIMYKEILDWAVNLNQKSTEELRLLYWCLQLRLGSDTSEWEVASAEKMFNPQAMKQIVNENALNKYRIEVVVDKIIQRRCVSLIRVVLQNQDKTSFYLGEDINKQCLKAMYEYLESKNESYNLPTMPEFDPIPTIPLCYWCKGPLEFPSEKFDYLSLFEDVDKELKSEFDKETLTGFKWSSRRHPVKEYGMHKPELCILSLLPLQFPYRRCFNCSVTCLMEPTYDQLPYCPLCNSFMYPSQPALDIEDVEEEIEVHTFDMRGKLRRKTNEIASNSLRGVSIKEEPQETAEPMDLNSFSDQLHSDTPIPTFPAKSLINLDVEPVDDDWADQVLTSSESEYESSEDDEEEMKSTSDDE